MIVSEFRPKSEADGAGFGKFSASYLWYKVRSTPSRRRYSLTERRCGVKPTRPGGAVGVSQGDWGVLLRSRAKMPFAFPVLSTLRARCRLFVDPLSGWCTKGLAFTCEELIFVGAWVRHDDALHFGHYFSAYGIAH